MAAAMQRRIPNDNDRPLVTSLPDNGVSFFYRCKRRFKKTGFTLGRNHCRRIDDDRFNVLIVVVRQVQKQEARLSGNGDADFIGKCKPAAALPVLFGDKDLNQRAQMSTLSIFQHAVMGDVMFNDLFPVGRKWNCCEFFTAIIGKPLKHGGFPVSYTHLRAHETPEHLVCRLLLATRLLSISYAVFCLPRKNSIYSMKPSDRQT